MGADECSPALLAAIGVLESLQVIHVIAESSIDLAIRKLYVLFATLPAHTRQELFGYAPMAASTRTAILKGFVLTSDCTEEFADMVIMTFGMLYPVMEDKFDIKDIPLWVKTSVRSLPEINFIQSPLVEGFDQLESESLHAVLLSSSLGAAAVRESVHRTMRPGGIVLIECDPMDVISTYGQLSWQNESVGGRQQLLGIKSKVSKAPLTTISADLVLANAREGTSVLQGTFFKHWKASTMSRRVFLHTQRQFRHAKNYFSRPMAALISRITAFDKRIDVLANIVEEHGDFDKSHSHSQSFLAFVGTMAEGIDDPDTSNVPSPPVHMFNSTLMAVSQNEPAAVAAACMGIIEYTFSDISAMIAEKVIANNWVTLDRLVHYNLHAAIDKDHAEDFFILSEDAMNGPGREEVLAGLRLGAYVFNKLYEDLYANAVAAMTPVQMPMERAFTR